MTTEAKKAKKLGKQLTVIGHEEILDYLEKNLCSARMAHAYLFLGPDDVGKESVARWWLEKILHQGKEGGERHSLENHPDVAVIERIYDEKTNKKKKLISINQIRDLREKMGLTSFLNTYKIALIRQADHLSIEAANALLKTLEEPSGKAIIILLARDLGKIPQTIASRCQVIKFRNVPEKTIYDALRQRGAERDQAELLSRLAAGSPGVAFKFYEDKEKLEEYNAKVNEFLEITKQPIWQRFLYIDDNIKTRGDREEQVGEVKKIISVWQGVLRDAMLVSLGMPELMVNYWARDQIESWVSNFDTKQIIHCLNAIKRTSAQLEQNVNIKLALENFLLEF
jgi:DNA polymerase-3 subunit delta'